MAFMRGLKFCILLELVVTTATTSPPWEDIFNINIRSINESSVKLSRVSTQLLRQPSALSALWLLEFADASMCHDAIEKYFGRQYGIVNGNYGLVEARRSQLELAVVSHPELGPCLKRNTHVPPAARVSRAVGASSCPCTAPGESATDCDVTLAVTASPLLTRAPAKDKQLFLQSLQQLSPAAPLPLLSMSSSTSAETMHERNVASGGETKEFLLFTVDSDSGREFSSSSGEVLLLRTHCAHALQTAHTVSLHPQVLWVEPLPDVSPLNRWATSVCQSGEPDKPLLHWANITGDGEVLGIADSGLDVYSCFLFDSDVPVPWDTRSSLHRKIVSYRASSDRQDSSGHGTLAAGSALGQCTARKYRSSAAYDGIARGAKVAFMDIGKGAGTTDDPEVLRPPGDLNANLFSVLYDDGARVLSVSWGVNSNEYTTYARSLDQFMWERPDALVVVAAGNDGGSGFSSLYSPSVAKNCLSVGASLNDAASWDEFLVDRPKYYSSSTVAGFSSKGPTADGRHKPDVLAPGWYVTSSDASASGKLHGRTAAVQGTSFAAPLAAGAALLVRQWFLRGHYRASFVPSGALLKAMLVHSGQALTDSLHNDNTLRSTAYGDYSQGYGRLQLDRVLSATATNEDGTLSLFVMGAADPSSEFYAALGTQGEQHTYEFRPSSSTDPLKITLAYTDIPPAAAASEVLVNNLDIVLRNGTHVWYSLHANKNPSAPASVAPNDRLNNVEVIVVDKPTLNGTYTLQVIATALQTTQPYAIVATSSLVPLNFTAQSTSGKKMADVGLSIKARAAIAAMISITALLIFYALWFMGFMSFLNFDKWCACLVGKKKRKSTTRSMSRVPQSYSSTMSAGECCGCDPGCSSSCIPHRAGREISHKSDDFWASVVGALEDKQGLAEVGLYRLDSVELRKKTAKEECVSEFSASDIDSVEDHSAAMDDSKASGQKWMESSCEVSAGQQATQTPPPEAEDRAYVGTVSTATTPSGGTRRGYTPLPPALPDALDAETDTPVRSVLLGDIDWQTTPDPCSASKKASRSGSTGLISQSPHRDSAQMASMLSQSPPLLEASKGRERGSEREGLPSPILPRQISRQRRHSEGSSAVHSDRISPRRDKLQVEKDRERSERRSSESCSGRRGRGEDGRNTERYRGSNSVSPRRIREDEAEHNVRSSKNSRRHAADAFPDFY